MGPRFFNRGNHFAVPVSVSGAREASMGPRFFNRGNVSEDWTSVMALTLASMGPRFFNRGNFWVATVDPISPDSFNGAAVFQPRKP